MKLKPKPKRPAVTKRPAIRITPGDLRQIMLDLADKICEPGAYSAHYVALDADGNTADPFYGEAVTHDLLGWIMVLGHAQWPDFDEDQRRNVGTALQNYIDSHIRVISGDQLRLITLGQLTNVRVQTGDRPWEITLGEPNVQKIATFLRRATDLLPRDKLPKLCSYSQEPQLPSREEKQRLEEEAARELRRLAKEGRADTPK